MQIRWSSAASEDVFHIVEFIRKENTSAAQCVADAIYVHVSSLSSFSHMGRQGHVEGTREMPGHRFPVLLFTG
jgi:plasmid stabilization system protein ParE